MSTDSSDNCADCHKSSFSLLLLRPSPIAKSQASGLVPLGAPGIVSDPSLVAGLVPAREPTESRYALRLLREGYVYVYIPEVPKGFKSNWLIYRVMNNGDLIPQGNPIFDQNPYKACSRDGHNSAGMKLLEIPKADLLVGKTLWIAYSANLWNDTLLRRNGANPKVMRSFVIGGENANAFQPTAELLSKHVLECKVRLLNINGWLDHDFPFCNLVHEKQTLAENLKRAAAGHAKTKDKELALVLADPAGLATELNALRLLRHEITKADLAQPENAHPITSLQMLDGLQKSVIDNAEAEKTEGVTEYMNKWAFETIMYKNGNPRNWPEGTTWEVLTDPEAIEKHGRGIGRLVFPDQDEREAKWAAWAIEQTWKKYRQYIDEDSIKTWKTNFDSAMRKKHGDPQARFEADWWAARQDKLFRQYFALHFDKSDLNPPQAMHSAGCTYAQEARCAMTPQPLADSPIATEYLKELDYPLDSDDAIVMRAMVANQSDLLAFFKDYTTSQRQDKMHDLGAGVFTRLKEKLNPADVKYGWLMHAGFGVSSLTLLQSWSAALGALGSVASLERINLLRSAMMVSETLAMARESAAKGSWLKTPVQISIDLTVAEARELLANRKAAHGSNASDVPSSRRIKQLAGKQGRIRLTLLSDNHELAALGGDPRTALAAGAGSIALDAKSVTRLPSTTGALAVTEGQFLRLLGTQPTRIKLAADTMREVALLGRGATLSLEGHIGLLGAWINGWGLIANYKNAEGTKDALLWANTFDSFFGLTAGTAQIAEAALSASLLNRVGAEAAKNALPMLGLRVVTSGAGAASGFAVMVGQFIKAGRQLDGKQYGAFVTYGFSGVSFLGLTAASGVQFVGTFSEFMIARGAKAAIWRTGAAMAAGIETRLVTRGVLGVVGIGLTGWGLIFLAAGLAFEIIAFTVAPSELQTYVRRSRFGTGPDNYKSYPEEFKALEKLMKAA